MANININEQILFLRKQKGVTQEELARALGLTNQSVSKWEAGSCCPDIQLLPDIAAYFNVTVDQLLGYKSADSFADVYLKIKELFKQTPEKEAFSVAFKLAALLHEGAASRGYKGFIHWDTVKDYGLNTEINRWGLSICSEPEGATMHKGNGIFISDQKYWQSVKTNELREIYAVAEMICDIKVLKVLYALYEMTVDDFSVYVLPEEISSCSKLPVEDVLTALDKLPTEVKDNEEGLCMYRIEGRYMHLPSLLLMLRMK